MTLTPRAVRHEELLAQLPWVKGLARSLLGDASRADDLAQDVLAQALETPPLQPEGPRLRAWLASVLRLRARDTRRADARRAHREKVAARPEAEPSSDEVVWKGEIQRRLVEAVMELEEPYRSTVLYRYLDELTSVEIARRIGSSPAAVRKRLSRALAQLRGRLEGELGEQRLLGGLLLLVGMLRFDRVAALSTLTQAGGGTMMVLKAGSVASAVLTMSALLWTQEMDTPQERVALAPPAGELDAALSAVSRAWLEQTPGAWCPGSQPAGEEPGAPETPQDVDGLRDAVLREWLAVPPSPHAPHAQLSEAKCSDCHTGNPHPIAVQPEAACTDCHVADPHAQPLEPAPRAKLDLSRDGLSTTYHAGGTTRHSAGQVVLGERHGVWSEWSQQGALTSQGEYFAGEQHGTWREWSSNGVLLSHGDYLYGRREGVWSEYAPDGKLRKETTYRGGKPHGLVRSWHANGKLATSTEYHAGVPHGAASTWHEQGPKASEGRNEAGTAVGAWLRWTPGGQAVSPGR